MSENLETAKLFIEACDTGKGWEACKAYCQADAKFVVQANALDGIESVEAYTEWAKGILAPLPDAGYEMKSIGEDSAAKSVTAYSIFRGTNTGKGGPIEATGKKVETDYVYVLEFDGGKIRRMTKIWNDGFALKQLGWC